jgi:hypothetical protein
MKKVLLALAVSSLIASPAFASSALSGLTATYGCVVNTNAAAFVVQRQNASNNATNFVQANTIEILNFSTNQWNALVAGSVYFGTASASTQVATVSGTAVETAGPFTGSYTETITRSDGTAGPIYNIIPVNSGNTLLVQRVSVSTTELPETGVCQKQ